MKTKSAVWIIDIEMLIYCFLNCSKRIADLERELEGAKKQRGELLRSLEAAKKDAARLAGAVPEKEREAERSSQAAQAKSQEAGQLEKQLHGVTDQARYFFIFFAQTAGPNFCCTCTGKVSWNAI